MTNEYQEKAKQVVKKISEFGKALREGGKQLEFAVGPKHYLVASQFITGSKNMIFGPEGDHFSLIGASERPKENTDYLHLEVLNDNRQNSLWAKHLIGAEPVICMMDKKTRNLYSPQSDIEREMILPVYEKQLDEILRVYPISRFEEVLKEFTR